MRKHCWQFARFVLFTGTCLGGALLCTGKTHAFGLLDRLFHPERYQTPAQTAYAPVVPNYTALAMPAAATQTAYYGQQPCSTCTTTCTQRVCNYVPQTAYRTAYVNTPVTTYRPVVTGNPCSGCTTTCMQPVTSYVMKPTVVPYTTYRQVCQTVVGQPVTTAMPVVPAFAAQPAAVTAAMPAAYAGSSYPAPTYQSAMYAAVSSPARYPASAYVSPLSGYAASSFPQPTSYAPSGLVAPASTGMMSAAGGCSTCEAGTLGGYSPAMGMSGGAVISGPTYGNPTYSSPAYSGTLSGDGIQGGDYGQDGTIAPSLPQGTIISPAPGSDASGQANRAAVPPARRDPLKANQSDPTPAQTQEPDTSDIHFRRIVPQAPPARPVQDAVAWQRNGQPKSYHRAVAHRPADHGWEPTSVPSLAKRMENDLRNSASSSPLRSGGAQRAGWETTPRQATAPTTGGWEATQ